MGFCDCFAPAVCTLQTACDARDKMTGMETSVLTATALAVARAGLGLAPAPALAPGQMPEVWSWLERRGLGPLTAAELLPAAEGQSALAASIRGAYRENLARGLYLTAAAQQALAQLTQAGIAALVFKGPALALAAYGGLDRRGFDDIDILIAPEAAPRALAVLAGAGWMPRLQLNGWQLSAYRRDFAALELVRADGAQLDLHWRFTESWFPVALPVAEMLARRCPLAAPAPPGLMTLAPADHFAVVAVHAAKHGWRDLRLVADAAAAAGQVPAAAWPAVIEGARRGGYARMVRLNLELARQLLNLPLPPGAASVLAPVDPIAARLLLRLSRRCLAAPALPQLPDWRLLGQLRERRGDAWRGAASLLFCLTPRDWALAPLPRGLAPLYYPMRAGRLLLRLLPRRRLQTTWE